MSLSIQTFELSQLWRGCILGSIAHAVYVSRYPDFAAEQSWDDLCYCVSDSAGSRGAIAFTAGPAGVPAHCMGLLRDDISPRNPSATSQGITTEELESRLPSSLTILADEASQYMLEEINDEQQTVFTTAIWSENEKVILLDPESDFLYHGGHLLLRQMAFEMDALAKWESDFELDAVEVQLVQSLYRKKIQNPSQDIFLTNQQWAVLHDSRAGASECQQSLFEVGIRIPV